MGLNYPMEEFSQSALAQVCSGAGPEECRTVYESSCSTKYVETAAPGGKFLADTACEKLPLEICGAGCTYEDGEQECHDKARTEYFVKKAFKLSTFNFEKMIFDPFLTSEFSSKENIFLKAPS